MPCPAGFVPSTCVYSHNRHEGCGVCRAYGRFNLSLWDDVMVEFQPLTDEDVIVVNFGAWYPRYNVHESG